MDAACHFLQTPSGRILNKTLAGNAGDQLGRVTALRPWAAYILLFVVFCLSQAVQASQVSANSKKHELKIARLIFEHNAMNHWGPGRPWWAIDWPEAEAHFTDGVSRYTNIDIADDSEHVRLTDDNLFDYPWLFAQQVGRWHLSTAEKDRLREYLRRGGFLVVDDFHGPRQWQIFLDVIDYVVGSRQITELNPDEPIMHVLYSLDSTTQIPGRRHLLPGSGGVSVNMPHSPSRFRGVYDEAGRLMIIINFNSDMGDAWEHADDPVYPVPMTATAYRFGINYLVYALTH